MDEKCSEALLPPITGHMVTIPNDVQQLTIKDSTIFIGKGHPHRSASSGCRCLSRFTLILVTIMVAVVLLPTVYHLIKGVSISGTADSGYYVSLNRDILNTLNAAMTNVERMTSSLSNVFGQASSKSDATILYSFRDPSYYLSQYFTFKTVYIARSGQTTLSFFIQNNQGSTLLDDVSVKTSYGSELLVNGGFDNSDYGWQGLSYATQCYSGNSYSYCANSKYATNNTVSQTFNTTPGSLLNISFNLRWDSSGSGIFTKVIIYP